MSVLSHLLVDGFFYDFKIHKNAEMRPFIWRNLMSVTIGKLADLPSFNGKVIKYRCSPNRKWRLGLVHALPGSPILIDNEITAEGVETCLYANNVPDFEFQLAPIESWQTEGIKFSYS